MTLEVAVQVKFRIFSCSLLIECSSVISLCDACSSDSVCTKCSSNYVPVSNGVSCGCNTGWVDTGSDCQQSNGRPGQLEVLESSGLSGYYKAHLVLIWIDGAIAGIIVGAVAVISAVSCAIYW